MALKMNGTAKWTEILDFPLEGRQSKPRNVGWTMIIDKGLGVATTQELVEIAAPYIDIWKLGFGTSALYPRPVLEKKLEIIVEAGIHTCPGGTFLEIALLQDKLVAFLDLAQEMGYTCIEVSDGTIVMDRSVRRKAISLAREKGLQVITELGKKDPRDQVATAFLIRQGRADLADGAHKVIIEGRESGKGIMIYDQQGKLRVGEMEEIAEGLGDVDRIIWEAPLKSQQQELILRFGPNVNLGNIPPGEVLALEALRRGLRGDTLRACLARREQAKAAIADQATAEAALVPLQV